MVLHVLDFQGACLIRHTQIHDDHLKQGTANRPALIYVWVTPVSSTRLTEDGFKAEQEITALSD